MKLYEIDNAIMDCVDMETGEIIDVERLSALQMERDQKIEGIGCWIKNLLSDAKALKEEKDNFVKFLEQNKFDLIEIISEAEWLGIYGKNYN